jgi:IS605 OrfB family transposase
VSYIIDGTLPLKKFLSSKELSDEDIVHSRYKQLIYKHASEIVRSQIEIAKKRRFSKYKRVYSYFKESGRQLDFLNKRYSELNLNDIIKTKYFVVPTLQHITIGLDSRFFDIKEGNYFDNYVKIILPYFNEKGTRALKINVPLKQHKHSNKLRDNGFKLRNNIQLKKVKGKYFINLIWEKEDVAIKSEGSSLGIDMGYNKLIVTSDNQFVGAKEMKNLYEKIGNKKQGSINFKQLLAQRDNLINCYINHMDFEDVNILYIEDLKNIKHKKKYYNNTIQRWSYRKTTEKLERICKEKGIYLMKVSPEYTSQTCSKCGCINSKSRNGEKFKCVSCGYEIDADYNAAINIRDRGTYSSSDNKTNFTVFH